MESGNRTVWIIVAVIVGILLCCCVVVAGAAVAGLLTTVPLSREVGFGRVEERTEQIFTVGGAPTLEVDNFAGDVVVRRGDSGQIRVIITKRALNSGMLDRIDVDASEQDAGVRIRTSRPGAVSGNMSVDLEIFVPVDTRLELETLAGNVRVDDVGGEISAHTNAGNVRVQGASAAVALGTSAGGIDYDGDPQGICTFDNGAGNITLRLPGDANVEVALNTGIGNISLGGFDVEGRISRTHVDGVIGTGEQATIEARTGVGNITIIRR
jgi:hypothetical protein